ncbi:MAG TPA: DUF4440 domain-containing protein [Candidatus Eisenbacteria bacterium]|nr:DUF4440 domain-containing protein [Candidatus Eisenbacteria bacterium]
MPTISALALALALGFGCARAPRADPQADAEAIRALSREWLAADQARDVERAVSFYAEDAVELASNTPIAVGKDAIRTWYESWLPRPELSISFATVAVEVAPSGELAWERGTYEFTTDTPKGKIVDTGKYLTVWKKVGGVWKVAADMANSDLPIPG